ncbi:hypothetical protein YC2023_053831 [Brassica napus]
MSMRSPEKPILTLSPQLNITSPATFGQVVKALSSKAESRIKTLIQTIRCVVKIWQNFDLCFRCLLVATSVVITCRRAPNSIAV